MRKVTITFKTNLSSKDINTLLNKVAENDLDKIAQKQIDWTIKKA